MSKTLNSTLPSQDSECILYVMEMKLVKPVTDEGNPKRRKIIDPFESNSAFGFLSSKELPKVENNYFLILFVIKDNPHFYIIFIKNFFRFRDFQFFNGMVK